VFGNAKPKDSVAAKPFGGFVFGQKTTAAVGVADVATGEENVATTAATPDVKANGGTPTAVELDQATYVELPVFGQKTVTTEVLDKPVEEDLMAKFKPAQGNWSCDVCMVSNPGDKSKCLACETPKPVAASSTEVKKDDLMAKFKPCAGNWSCNVCMVSNPGDKTKCLACETPKPGEAAAKTDDLMAKFKPSAGNWSCDVCMVSNPGDKTACLACETPKSGSAPAAIKTAPKPFAIGANGGFKFDAQPAADTSATGGLGGFKFVNTATATATAGGFKFEPSATGSNNTTVGSGFRCDVKTTESIATGGFKFESKSSEPSAGGFKFDTTKPKDSSTDKEGEGGFKFGGTNAAVKSSHADAAGGFTFGTKTSESSAETGGEGTGSTTGFFFKANGSSPPTGAAGGFTFSSKAGDTSPGGPPAKGFQFSTFGSSTPGKTTEGASIFGPAARSGGAASGFSFFNTPTSTRVRAEGGGTTAGSLGFQFSTPPEKPQVGRSFKPMLGIHDILVRIRTSD
jgi:hypothetical protein